MSSVASSSGKTKSSTSAGIGAVKRVKGENFYRDAKAASRLKMLNGGKPVYVPLHPPSHDKANATSGDWTIDLAELR